MVKDKLRNLKFLFDYDKEKSYSSNSREGIQSDSFLIFSLLKELFVFLLLLIPNLFILIFFVLFWDKKAVTKYSEKIFLEPFKILNKISEWFFEAEVTAYLSLFLIFVFVFQIFYLNYNEVLIHSLMTHQNHIFEGNFWSIVTAVFLHADFLHLFSNLLALTVFGRIVEKEFGFIMFFVFLGSGVIANLVSNFISYFQGNFYYSLGASGGIAGLIIFAVLLSPFSFTSLFIIPLPVFLVGWFLIIGDIVGLTSPASQINYLAHIGGYCALLVLFFFLEMKNRKKILVGFCINLFMLLLFYVFWLVFGSFY